MPDTTAERDTTTITVNRDFARMVRRIADHRDITMADVLDKYAGPAIARENRRVVSEMNEELGGES